jgi:hypothetical protein
MNEMQEDMGAHSNGADDDVDGFLAGAYTRQLFSST